MASELSKTELADYAHEAFKAAVQWADSAPRELTKAERLAAALLVMANTRGSGEEITAVIGEVLSWRDKERTA